MNAVPPSPSTPSRTPEPAPALGLTAPGRWLALGWRDFVRNPRPGLMHGALLAGVGWFLVGVAGHQFWWLVGAFSGFLLVAPVLAVGLYEVSRLAAAGKTMSCTDVWRIWVSGDRRLMLFGFLLAVAGTGWMLTSAGLITLWSPTPIHSPTDFFNDVVLGESPGLFEVWLLMGALLAAPVFASSVMTMPMLLDRRITVWEAVGKSWRVVATYPAVMALWAVLIALAVGMGFLTALLGLFVVVPVVGHASWHAYAHVMHGGAGHLSAESG